MLQQRKPENIEPTCGDGARSALLLVYQVFGFFLFYLIHFFRKSLRERLPVTFDLPPRYGPRRCCVLSGGRNQAALQEKTQVTLQEINTLLALFWETIFTQYRTEDVTLTYI